MIDVRLGAYRTISELGSGGMGTVYLAEVVEPVADLASGDRVALKVIHTHLMSTPGFFKRFLREGEIGQRIRHENVVATLDVDGTQVEGSAVLFLATEYVRGQTLRRLLDELTVVPEELCLHIAREVTRALEAVHAAQVIHRDLKPENVLITEEHVVKLMDLGIARLQDEADGLSRAGTFVGSVLYAAPEQFTRPSEEIDGRADLYALGLLLFELATGTHPFGEGDLRRLMQAHIRETPPRARSRNDRLSAFFEEVVATLLAKDPGERFESADALGQILGEGEASVWWQDRATSTRCGAQRLGFRIPVTRESPLHGRDEELAVLRRAFDEACSGEGRVVLLEGEDGIGKTRLVDEMAASLCEQGVAAHFLYGAYPPAGAATGFRAFRDSIVEHFGRESLDRRLHDHLAGLRPLAPAAAALFRGEPPAAGIEPLGRDAIQTVLVQLLRSLAEERPTILFVDDLHFAPDEDLAVFAALALAAPESRVLLMGSARLGLPDAWRAEVDRLPHSSRVELRRLGPRDIRSLLVDAFRSERLADELGWQVARKSDGNPLFVLEILRELQESDRLHREDDGSWTSTGEIRDITLPSSVVDLIEGRLGLLGPDERDLLDVAACCGFRFDPLLVAETLGLARIPALKLLAHIEQRHRLVHASERQYVFDHHQIHEALETRLSPLLREQYHVSLAEALLNRSPDGSDRTVDIVEHFLVGRAGERALPLLGRALDHLERSHRNDAAVRLANLALAADGLLDRVARADVLLRKAGRLDLLGRRDEERAALDEALRLADASGDAPTRIRALRRLGIHLLSVFRGEEARKRLERALQLARETGERREEGSILANLGAALKDLGRWNEAMECYGLAIEIHRETGDGRGEALACSRLGVILVLVHRHREAHVVHDRAVRLARAIGDRKAEGIACGNLGSLARHRGRFDLALRLHEEQLDISREVGYRRGEAGALGALAYVQMQRGRYGRAGALLTPALEVAREIGDRQGVAFLLWLCGLISAQTGDLTEGERLSLEAIGHAEEAGVRPVLALASLVRAWIEDQRGDPELARRRYDEAIERWPGESAPGPLQGLTARAVIDLRAGRNAEARTALEAVLTVAGEDDIPGAHTLAAAYLGLLGEDPGPAIRSLESSSDRMPLVERMEAHFVLWRAGAGREHLEAAAARLDELIDGAPDADPESLITNVRLHREIREATPDGDRDSRPDVGDE